MFKKIIFSMFALFVLTGCQAAIYGTASQFNELELGMTKAKIIEVLGTPTSRAADGDKGEEYFIYKKMKHAVSAWPRTYKVTFREDKVVKWGEQYNEQNINVF
ncbi:outer membrane protein assembly factor BamE [Gammaproteobacteria bacterium AS21]